MPVHLGFFSINFFLFIRIGQLHNISTPTWFRVLNYPGRNIQRSRSKSSLALFVISGWWPFWTLFSCLGISVWIQMQKHDYVRSAPWLLQSLTWIMCSDWELLFVEVWIVMIFLSTFANAMIVHILPISIFTPWLYIFLPTFVNAMISMLLRCKLLRTIMK